MIQLASRFLKFDALNVIPEVWIGMGVIYLILVFVSLLSIRFISASRPAKFAWACFVLVLPLVGMAGYSVWCMGRADFGLLRDIGVVKNRPPTKKKGK